MQPSRQPPSPPVPAVLHLVQTVMRGRWRATGEELYREVAALTGAGPGTDLIVSGSADGVTAEWLAARTGAIVTGVDADAPRIARAESRGRRRATPAGSSVSYELAPLDDLPHETAVFDAAVGETAIAAASDPERAVRELVRVTRPMGHVVLLVPTWTSEIIESDRDALAERLGFRPRLLVEWKQMMREAGLVDIAVQDWSDGAPSARSSATPRDAMPALTWRQKTHIAARAWRRRGWRAARGAVRREQELLDELARDRALGFQLLSGVKWPHARVT